MTTANSIISAALRKINAIDASEPIAAADFEAAIDALNRMMVRWEADGVSVGWSPVANPGDQIYAPPETHDAIIYNLAIDLSSEYGMTPNAVVTQLAVAYLSRVTQDVYNAQSMRVNTDEPRSAWGQRWNIIADGPTY